MWAIGRTGLDNVCISIHYLTPVRPINHAHPRVNIWASDAAMVNGLPTSSNSTIITFRGASKPLSTRDVELFLKSTATAYHQKLALF